MIGIRVARIAMAAFALVVAGGVPAVAATVELKGDQRGHFLARAAIDNVELNVIVDTGASAVVLSHEDAQAVGLNPRRLDYAHPVGTANGVIQSALVTLRRVEIGAILLRDVEALVLPPGALNGTLLGMSFLSRLKGFRVRDGILILEK